MNRRKQIIIALGLVSLFAIAFVVISASPRRRIPPGSIVLIDRSPMESVSWLLVSNRTAKGQTVAFPGVLWQANWFAKVPPHDTKKILMPGPLSHAGDLQMIVSEELKAPERWLQAAQTWINHHKVFGFGWNPLNGTYYGHPTDMAPEFLKRGTNRIAKGACAKN